jgi:hypothetical protein
VKVLEKLVAMLSVDLDEENGIATLEPGSVLTKSDFKSVATVLDPYIEKTGRLNGLVIHTKSFPGWDSFAALFTHLRFVKDHHKNISRVAFSTDSVIGNLAEVIASHFVSAEIKRFSYQEIENARLWVSGHAGS